MVCLTDIFDSGGAGGDGPSGTVVKSLSTTDDEPGSGDPEHDRAVGAANGPVPQEDFYRYVLSHPQVSASVMGLRDIDEFKHVRQPRPHHRPPPPPAATLALGLSLGLGLSRSLRKF